MKLLKNKSIRNHIILCALVVCLMFGCSDDKGKMNPLSQMQKRLRGTWTVSEVTLSGTDVSIFYANLTLTFNSNYSYACDNEVDPVWPAVGTYENILENDLQIILRDDGIRMRVISLTANNLVIQFTWAGDPNGKLKDLNGEYEFTFTK
jgi:Lipocalin-like domain